MSTLRKQLVVLVTFHIHPEKIEQWKAVHRLIWTPVQKETECVLFDVFESTEQPGRIRLMEIWDGDRDWFEGASLYFLVYMR